MKMVVTQVSKSQMQNCPQNVPVLNPEIRIYKYVFVNDVTTLHTPVRFVTCSKCILIAVCSRSVDDATKDVD